MPRTLSFFKMSTEADSPLLWSGGSKYEMGSGQEKGRLDMEVSTSQSQMGNGQAKYSEINYI